MTTSIKEKYADFISSQIDSNSDYLPTFSKWIERRRFLENMQKDFSFPYTTKDFGRITIRTTGLDVEEARKNADAVLVRMQRKYDDQKGNRGALTTREIMMRELAREEKELQRETERLEKQRTKIVALASKLA